MLAVVKVVLLVVGFAIVGMATARYLRRWLL
jgi:hypothetical protein